MFDPLTTKRVQPLTEPVPPQQAPDYRLYKSEPELTTVKEEVDEANGEDKAEASAESKGNHQILRAGLHGNLWGEGEGGWSLTSSVTDITLCRLSSSAPLPRGHRAFQNQISHEPPRVLHHRLLRHLKEDQEARTQISKFCW